MSNKTHLNQHNSREYKKEQFSKPAKSYTNSIILVVIVALLAVVGYLAIERLNQKPVNASTGAQTIEVNPGGADIRIPVSDVVEGQAKFYQAALPNGKSARFFAVKTSDGVYRTVLDACQVCFNAHKGYYQDGSNMVCRNCGRHFQMNSVGNGTTGCHPIGLHGTVGDNDISIPVSDLENGAQYF